MLLEREDSFMSEFEDACSAWVDSVGSSPSDGAESDVGSPFCQGVCVCYRNKHNTITMTGCVFNMWFID